MNIQIEWIPNEEAIKIYGKTIKANIPIKLCDRLLELFTIEKFKEIYPDLPMRLYGEGYGKDIQSGGKYISGGVSFILFDVLIDGWWLRREDIVDVAYKLGLIVVPIIGTMSLRRAVRLIKTRTLTSKWGDFLAEGMVLKPNVELKTRAGDRVITKLKHKDFTIKK